MPPKQNTWVFLINKGPNDFRNNTSHHLMEAAMCQILYGTADRHYRATLLNGESGGVTIPWFLIVFRT